MRKVSIDTFYIHCIINILLVLAFNACNTPSIDDFEQVEHLTVYDSIYSDKDNPFNSISTMAIVDSILITKHVNDEYHFSLINVETGKLIRRWGKKGRGPEEYVETGSGFCIYKDQLVFLDETQKHIDYVPLRELFQPGDSLHIKKEDFPYTVNFRPRHLVLLNNGYKIAPGCFKEGYFGVLDAANQIVENHFDYPFTYHGIEGIYRGTVFQTKICAQPTNNRFVVYLPLSDVFEIYQMTGQQIERVYTSTFKHIPQIGKTGNRYGIEINKSITGLMHGTVTDELICFAYSPEKDSDFYEKGGVYNEIYCFNWNGEKVKKYVLPFPISNYCINKEYIYGVRYAGYESIIYRFKL